MRILFCFCFFIALSHASLPKFPQRYQEQIQFKGKYTGKIVGGDAVKGCEEVPYQASIQRKSLMTQGFSHFCGASIISENKVLTAAHCVYGRSSSALTVVVGTHQLDSQGRKGIRRNIANITTHPLYASKDVDYDLAVLTLERSIDLKEDCVRTINIPPPGRELAPGTTCYATGWGTTSEGGSTSSTLRAVGVPIVSRSECERSYGAEDITSRMICAGLKDGGKDSCQGDSGGPLRCNDEIYGITSWGYGCARPEYYGVYTNVPFFSEWIYEQMLN